MTLTLLLGQLATTLTLLHGSLTPLPQQDALGLWIDKLAGVESNHREDIIILDVNGKYSYGCAQFQMATFKGYAIQYNFFDGEVDWRKEIMNCHTQKVLARAMLEADYENWRHWYTSVTSPKYGIGKPPTL
mgnify:CR=1 FL=1